MNPIEDKPIAYEDRDDMMTHSLEMLNEAIHHFILSAKVSGLPVTKPLVGCILEQIVKEEFEKVYDKIEPLEHKTGNTSVIYGLIKED